MIQRTLARLGVALTLLAAAGCGPIAAGVILALDGGGSSGNGTGGSGAQATQTSAPVGAAGGVVTLGQTAVVVPPGALSTTIQLSVALGSDVAGGEYVKVGQAIHLGPAGTTFASPVTVTLAFDPAQFPAGKTVADLIVQKRSDVGGTIVNLTPTAVDITSNRVTVQVSSFSTVQPVVLVGVDPAKSRVQASPSTVAPVTSDPSTITVTLLNPAGQPIPGRTVLLSTVGAVSTGVTITQPTQPTDAAGMTQGTISSVQTGTATVVAQVGTTLLDQQATVTFAFPPPPPPPPPPPIGTLTSITPAAGPSAGGTTVTLTGSGFTPATQVWFWGELMLARRSFPGDGTTIIHVDVPPAREGFQGRCNVVATTNGVHQVLPWGFHYGVSLESVTPAGAPLVGGTAVTIKGGGFVPGTTFTIGGAAVPGTIVDLNTFQGTAPAGASGLADVVVTSGADSATRTGGFTYGPPTVTGVTPASGSLGGGGLVQISGTGFSPDATATVDGAALTKVEVISPTLLVGVAPAGSLGAQDVQVTTGGGSDTLVGAYTYAALAVDALSPDIVRAGLTVTLRGGGFDPTPGNNAVTFNGAAATVLSATPTELTVVVPASPTAGSVVVGVGGSFSAPRAYALGPVDLGYQRASPRLSGDGRLVFYWNQDVANQTDLQDRLTGAVELVKPDRFHSISRDGRFCAWHTALGNVVLGDPTPPGNSHGFLFDRTTRATVAVSVDVHGRQLNSQTQDPSVSDDGRFVAFMQQVPGSGLISTYLYDRQLNRATSLVVDASGNPLGTGLNPCVSGDGRYVFVETAVALVSSDVNGYADVYRYEIATGVWTLVSVTAGGVQGNQVSSAPVSSRDGRFVVFVSLSSNLVPNDTNGSLNDIFLKDLQTGALERVNLANDQAEANGSTRRFGLSDDGRYVVFSSHATNLVASDPNGSTPDVYVRDMLAKSTMQLSLDAAGNQLGGVEPTISADGRYVAFYDGGAGQRLYLVPR